MKTSRNKLPLTFNMLNEKIYHEEISLMKTKKLNVTQPTVGMKVDDNCDLITLFISQKSNQQHSVCGNTATTCQFKKEKKRESKSFSQQVQ